MLNKYSNHLMILLSVVLGQSLLVGSHGCGQNLLAPKESLQMIGKIVRIIQITNINSVFHYITLPDELWFSTQWDCEYF